MALEGIQVGLAMVLVTIFLWSHAAAQSSCTTAIISLSPCLNYITGNSSTPSTSCCTQLESVVKSQPQCLCTVLNGGGSSLGITINETRALALPGVCNVQTPPVSQCNGKSPAAGGPTTSPADSPLGTPAAGSGSKTIPSTGGDSSDASSTITLPLSVFFFSLFIASYASTFASF